jgi:glycosyltransferase involved in cell wall biosynthesis
LRVINAMFGRKKGDIEQIFIEYIEELIDLGCEVEVLTYQDAAIADLLPSSVKINTITNFGQWDPVASWKLKKLTKELSPDIIIAHGNRAANLLSKSITDVPVVSVFHNYNAKIIGDCKNIIAITEDLRKFMVKKGLPSNAVFTVPNSVVLPEKKEKRKIFTNTPPVIGAMGKFIAKRGFVCYLRALSILKDKGLEFKAILMGDGVEKQVLQNLAASLNLKNHLEFRFEEDKKKFYEEIDVFCLPSLQEPFGVTILEAFTHGVAVVTTDTEGPIEIIKPHVDALVVSAGEDYALADAFEKLIRNPKFAERIADAGYNKVATAYNKKIIGNKIHDTLKQIIKNHQATKTNIKVVEAVIQ